MILKLGMSGPEVANLERVIEAMGFDGVPMDGVFDEHLENVIKYIQKTNNLTIDGIVGPKTLDKLDELYQPGIHNFSSSGNVPDEDLPDVLPQPDTKFKKLENVHPILVSKVTKVIEMARVEGYNVTVTQGLRTFAEQNKLFQQRPKVTNARGGQSYHNYGVAADLAFILDGKLTWDDKYYKNIGRWANQIGLTWGGNWKFVDFPHLQLLNMPATRYLLAAYQKGGIPLVWSTYIK